MIVHRHSITLLWLVVVSIVVVLFVRGAAIFYDQILILCTGPECLPWQRGEFDQVSASTYATWQVIREAIQAGAFIGIGALMIFKAGRSPIAVLGAFAFVLFGAVSVSDVFESLSRESTGWRIVVGSLQCVGSISVIWFILLFPDGRFLPGWSRVVAFVWLPFTALTYIVPQDSIMYQTSSQMLLVALLVLVLTFVAQLVRYRRYATPLQRQQSKWVVLGFVISTIGLIVAAVGLPLIGPDIISNRRLFAMIGMGIASVFLMVIPVTIALAMLRYRLWDVDRLVNRTIVYSVLTGLVIVLYSAVVTLASRLTNGSGTTVGSILAAGIIAVSFQPIRFRLQRRVNRILYGDRDEPNLVLARLGEQLELALDPETMLDSIAETLMTSLRVPYVEIVGPSPSGTILTSAGSATDRIDRWPLNYQGEPVGSLGVASRSPDELLNPADRALISAVARQAGLAVHAVQTTADLRLANARLITARDEERSRLRRDLHDGLGPQLASQTLTLDAAIATLSVDPAAANTLLADLRTHLQDSIDDVRRVIYALRPMSLEGLGLVGSIREAMRQYEHSGVTFEVISAGNIPDLPVQIETATYRIVQEATTNVVRHAGATKATISLSVQSAPYALAIEIWDNGRGIDDESVRGVGLDSMEERAADLGGVVDITTGPGSGTAVNVVFPLGAH